MKAKLKGLTKFFKPGVLSLLSEKKIHFSRVHQGSVESLGTRTGVEEQVECLALKKILEITDAMVDASESMPHLEAVLQQHTTKGTESPSVDFNGTYLLYDRYLSSIGCSSSVQGMKSDSLDGEYGSLDTSNKGSGVTTSTYDTLQSIVSFRSSETTYYDT